MRKEIKIQDSVTACDIIEGFTEATDELILEAWAFLIRTKLVWHLQGFYVRGAQQFIDSNIIDIKGNILCTDH